MHGYAPSWTGFMYPVFGLMIAEQSLDCSTPAPLWIRDKIQATEKIQKPGAKLKRRRGAALQSQAGAPDGEMIKRQKFNLCLCVFEVNLDPRISALSAIRRSGF
jgi:hypothetical protein